MRQVKSIALATCLSAATLQLALAKDGLAEDADQSDTSWPTYNNDYASQRFSPLKAIDAGNVAGTKEICRIELSDSGSLQSGPILVDGAIYVTTGLDTFAIDPSTCKQIWKSTRQPVAHMPLVVNRDATYSDGMIIRGTPDDHLIALDAKTGAAVWDNQITDTSYGEFASAARISMRPSSVGGIWGAFTLDIREGQLFVSVGNPAQDFLPGHRPGDNMFTNSLVALDARTGGLKWWYQAVKNDPWDYDLASAAVLYQSKAGYRDYAAVAGKDGYLHVVDRATHKLIFKTAVTTQFKQGPAPTKEGTKHCPGNIGGVEWNEPAYDVSNHQLIVGAVDWCFISTMTGLEYVRGQLKYGGSTKPAPNETATGWFTAVDADSGAVKWKSHTEAPVVAAVTPTADGVTFAGDSGGLRFVDGVHPTKGVDGCGMKGRL